MKHLFWIPIIVLFFPIISIKAEDVVSEKYSKQGFLEPYKFKDKKDYKKWCEKSFNILWEKAKEGNVEARTNLLMDYWNFRRFMPGSEDWLTIKRDLIVLLVYTSGYDRSKNGGVEDALQKDFMQGGDYKKYNECMKTNKGKECLDLALREELVPKFEDYAAEIDFQISRGKVSRCGRGMAFIEDRVGK